MKKYITLGLLISLGLTYAGNAHTNNVEEINSSFSNETNLFSSFFSTKPPRPKKNNDTKLA